MSKNADNIEAPPPIEEPAADPRQTLRAWMPHLLALVALAVALRLVALVLAPIADAALLAAALAGLSYPILFAPLNRLLRRIVPRLYEPWRRRAAAATATVALVTVLASPLLLMLFTSLSPGEATTVLTGVVTRNPQRIEQLAALGYDKAQKISAVYPDLPINADAVSKFIHDTLDPSRNQVVLGLVMHGTGGFLAEMLLTLILVFSLFEHGPRLMRLMLAYSPLDAHQRILLRSRFRDAVLHLLNDTVAAAVLRGLAMGLIAWAIGGFNAFIVAVVTAFVSLVPVVGLAFVWVPLASLLWSRHDHAAAICLIVASLVAAWMVLQLNERIRHALDPQGMLRGFLLFLGLVGGLLSFGTRGLIIGPFAVVILAVLAGFWLPLYGVGKPDDGADSPPEPD